MGEATKDPVRMPPGPRIPKAVMGIAFLTARHRAVARGPGDSLGSATRPRAAATPSAAPTASPRTACRAARCAAARSLPAA